MEPDKKRASEDDDILMQQFNEHLGEFLQSERMQSFRNELSLNYKMYTGDQWDAVVKAVREYRKKPVLTVNRVAPILNAIVGHAIVNQNEVEIYARDDDEEEEAKASERLNDVVECIEDDSDFYHENGGSTLDLMICGVGAGDTYFNYSNPEMPYGEVEVDRIFPGYLLFDPACSKKNMKDSRWRGYFEIVSKDALEEEIKAVKGDYVAGSDAWYSTLKSELATLFPSFAWSDDTGIIYKYQWREKVKIFKLANPLRGKYAEKLKQYSNDFQTRFFNQVGEFAEANDLDMDEGLWSVEPSVYRKFRELLDVLGALIGEDIGKDIRAATGEVYKYFTSRIAEGIVLERQECFAGAFTVNIKTGYYDEQKGHFYGLVRSMVAPQRAYNEAYSDYVSFLRSVPKGGIYLEDDAVEDPEEFVKSRVNEQDVTLLRSGSIASNKMMPKEIPGQVPGLMDFMQLNESMIYRVIGIEPEFLSAVQSGNMGPALFSKMIKQTLNVLAHILDAEKTFLKNWTRIAIECARVLAENNDGMKMRYSNQREVSIDKKTINKRCDIVITQKPLTEDEQTEIGMKLIELSATMLNKPNPVDITPLAIKYLHLPEKDKDEIMAMMQPKEPPKPDPLNIEMMMANIELTKAQARDTNSRVDERDVQLRERMQALGYLDAEKTAEIDKTRSETVENLAQANRSQ